MSKEVKLGAFALVVLAFFVWGYTFLKGKNLLNKSFTFETSYEDVSQLTQSSPIYLNGYKVGSVSKITLNPDNLDEMVVTFEVENDYKIPTDATAVLVSDGLVGGKAVSLTFDRQCTGADCAKENHRFKGKVQGFISSLVSKDEVEEYSDVISEQLKDVLEDLGSQDGKGALNQTILELQKTMENIASITAQTDDMIRRSSAGLTATINNMAVITKSLAENNEQISTMISNFSATSQQLKDANIGQTITSTTATVDEAKLMMQQLQSTLKDTDQIMANLNEVMAKANNGNGTLSKLLNDQSLYTNLESTSQNLSLLLQDLRLNPSRYVKVSVFGRKNNEDYVKPENDPAFESENEE